MQLSKKRRNDVLYVNVLLSIYRSDFMLIKMSIKHYRIIIICRQWMCNISYPSLNTLNRLIIVISCVAGQSASNTPTGITHLYIPEYTWIQVTCTQLTRSAHKLCWWGCGVCCYGDVYRFSNTATSRPGMLDLCLLADSPGPIDSLSLYLLFYVKCNWCPRSMYHQQVTTPAAFDARIHYLIFFCSV